MRMKKEVTDVKREREEEECERRETMEGKVGRCSSSSPSSAGGDERDEYFFQNVSEDEAAEEAEGFSVYCCVRQTN